MNPFRPYEEAYEWFKTQDGAVPYILKYLLPMDAIDRAIAELPEDYPIDDLLEMKPQLTDKRKSDVFKHASMAIDYRWLRSTGKGDLESREQLAEKYHTTAVHIFRLLQKYQQ